MHAGQVMVGPTVWMLRYVASAQSTALSVDAILWYMYVSVHAALSWLIILNVNINDALLRLLLCMTRFIHHSVRLIEVLR